MLNLVRTAHVVLDAAETALRAEGLSFAQYNVLRILRGAGEAGLGRNEIRDRLLSRMPDVTRLLDRMEAAGLVRRSRGDADRRRAPTTLTGRGRDLVDALDGPVAALNRRLFAPLGAARLRDLAEALTLVRAAAPETPPEEAP